MALTLSCGPEGARDFVSLPSDPGPAGAVARDGSISPSVGGSGGSEGGSGGSGGGGGSPGSSSGRDARPTFPPPDAPSGGGPDGSPQVPPQVDASGDRGSGPPSMTMPPDAAPPDSGPAPPPGVNLANGLVARWKLDEADGNTAIDSAGGNNTGILNGPVRVTAGFPAAKYPNPGALRFNGVNDFVELATVNLPRNNARQSVAFWFNFTAMPTGGAVCVSMTDGPAHDTRLKVGFNNGRVTVWKGTNEDLATAPAVAPGWHHYVYTYDGTTHRLYLDGRMRGMSNVAADNGPASNARLGAIYNDTQNYAGLLDEVRIYNRPLTQLEITALHDGFE